LVNSDNRTTEAVLKKVSENVTVQSASFELRKDSQLAAIPPQRKPSHIKVRKDAKGSYVWELSGDDVRDIIKLDRELRRAFPEETVKGGKDGKLFDKRSARDGSED
jgi:hypothetical protein